MRVRSLLAAALVAAVPCGIAAAGNAGAPARSGLPKAAQARQLELRAEGLQNARKFAEAAPLLQQAAELAENDWALWDKAGWAHLEAASAPAALKAFENARKHAPPGTPLHGGLIISQFALKNEKELTSLLRQAAPAEILSEATEVVKKGLAAKENTPDWNFALGYLYARVLRNSARGVGPMEAVVQSNPKNAQAWLLLVEMNQELDRGAQEDAAAVKYLELAPDTVDAFRIKAQRFVALRRMPEAIEEFKAGVAKYPTSDVLHYGLARAYERAGNFKEAEAAYRKLADAAAAQKLETLQAQARAQLANFHARRRNYAAAEVYYREAAQRPNATAGTWTTWGSLLALTGKWEDAAKALESAAERDEKEKGRSTPDARHDLLTGRYRAAVCWLAAGKRDPARKGFDTALERKTGARTSAQAEAAAFLTWLAGPQAKPERLAYKPSDERWAAFTWRSEPPEGEFEARGQFSAAATAWFAILQEVQKKNPNCWPADYALARLYAAAGSSSEAMSLLERAARGRADWWAPHFAMGQYYARTRNKERGVPALKRALQLAPECRTARTYLSLLSNLREEEDF